MSFSSRIEPPPEGGQLTGAILAGGLSRRLGKDKALLRLGGKPLAWWVAEALKPAVTDLWLVTNHPQAHLSLGLPLLTDLLPFQGPLGGLATAMFLARTPWVLAATVDTPFLSPELLRALKDAAPQVRRPVLVCRRDRGLEPFPGLYAVRLLPRLWEFLVKEKRVTTWLEEIRPQIWGPETWRAHDPEGHSFLNLNRPEDLKRLRAICPRRLTSGDAENLGTPESL